MRTSMVTKRLVLAFATLGLVIGVLRYPRPSRSRTGQVQGVRATIVGTNGSDDIDGTPRRDVIVARGGADDIEGKGGNDLICAGAGNDDVEGDRGRDRIFGGRGNDDLEGNQSDDFLHGGRGFTRVKAVEATTPAERSRRGRALIVSVR